MVASFELSGVSLTSQRNALLYTEKTFTKTRCEKIFENTHCMSEFRRYQKLTELLIHKLSFQRLFQTTKSFEYPVMHF